METLYFDEHIALQEEFGTRKLADMLIRSGRIAP